MARTKRHSDRQAEYGGYKKDNKVYHKKKGKGKKLQFKSTNGRDIRHRDQFKRLPPSQKEVEVKKTHVESTSESEEEPDNYQLLVSSLSHGKVAPKLAVDSEDESEEDVQMSNDTDEKNKTNLQSGDESMDDIKEDPISDSKTENDTELKDDSESESEIEVEPDEVLDKVSG